jgi:hypothetical protein
MRESGRVRALLAGVAVIVLAGCAGIPTSGPVHVGRQLPPAGGLGDVDFRILPPLPSPGMSPDDIVHGFLRAMVNDDGDYEIARSFLTPRAAIDWNANSVVTTYDDSGVSFVVKPGGGATRTIAVQAPRVGVIDTRGDYTPGTGTVRSTFELARQSGEWRIDRLPSGVLLSTLDAQRSFRLANVYYVRRAGTGLVPEQVLLRPGSRGVTTALVRALLSGPGTWIAPAVRTSFPAGTELLGNVPVDQFGVAEVNLSAALRQATGGQLKALSAQLVWTLRQVSEISAVRLLADGAPVAVPGVPTNQPRASWTALDPAARPAVTSGFFSDGGVWRESGSEIAGLDAATGLAGVAVSHRGDNFAGLRVDSTSATVVSGPLGRAPIARLTADTLTAPTIDRAGDVLTVATNGARRWVAVIAANGTVGRAVADRTLIGRQVQLLRLSRDGARVAAVVGAARHGRLIIGRVTVVRGQLHLSGFRGVLPGVPDVRGVAWDGADQVVVSASDASGGREVLAVDVDGYLTRTWPTAGLRPEPTDVAILPGQPLLVAAGGSVWLDDPVGGWRRLGRGTAPAYAD